MVSYNLKFQLCADSSCSSVLWTENYINADKVSVANGLFSIMLGQLTSLSSIDFNQTLYLEVSVGGTGVPSWEILTPRKLLGSVPNAFNAQKFDGLATTSFLRSDAVNARATITSLTSTNIFSSNVSGTNVTSTNLFASIFNALTSVIDNLTATIANITTLVFGSATGNSLTTTDLNVTSTANIKNLTASSSVAINSTSTNSTSTNFYSTNAVITGGSVATTTISGLAVSNFSSPNISQWTNNSGYLTSYSETDPVFMAASTSLPYQPIGSYLTTESDPVWLAASSSYLTVASATATYLPINTAASTYLTQASSTATYMTIASTTANYLTSATAASTYLTQAAAGTTYLSLASWYSTTTWPSTSLIVNGTSTLATTTITSDLSVNNSITANSLIADSITLGGVTQTSWPVGGGAGGSFWATTSNSLIGYPSLGAGYAITIGSNVTTSDVKFEVAGNTKFGGNSIITGGLGVSGTSTLANPVLVATSSNIMNGYSYSLAVGGGGGLFDGSVFVGYDLYVGRNATMTNAFVTNLNVSGYSSLSTTSLAYDSWIGSSLGTKSLQFKDYLVNNGSFISGNHLNFFDSVNDLLGLGVSDGMVIMARSGDNAQFAFGGEGSSNFGLINYSTSSRVLGFSVLDSSGNSVPYPVVVFNTDNLLVKSDNNPALALGSDNGSINANLSLNTSTGALTFNNATSYYFDNKVGIGTTSPATEFQVVGTSTFAGDVSLNKGLVDSLGSYGSSGNVLWSTGTSTLWVNTSTLGISSGITVESDPIWLAASSSYLTVASATATYLPINTAASTYLTQVNAASTYLTQASSTATYMTIASTTANYLTSATAASTYLTQAAAGTTYLSLSNWYSTTTWPSSGLTVNGNITSTGYTSLSTTTLGFGSMVGTNSRYLKFTDYLSPAGGAGAGYHLPMVEGYDVDSPLSGLFTRNTFGVVATNNDDPIIVLGSNSSEDFAVMSYATSSNSFTIGSFKVGTDGKPFNDVVLYTEKLSVYSSSSDSDLFFSNAITGSNATILHNSSTDSLVFTDATSYYFDNKVGIGTSSPVAYLSVVNNSMTDPIAVIGNQYNTVGQSAISIGSGAKAEGSQSVAIGNGAETYSSFALALGSSAYANGQSSVAIGYASARSNYATAIGYGANASNTKSIAIGDISVTGENSLGIGFGSASSNSSIVNTSNTMVIMGGKVGIGTTSPTTEFQVVGTSTFTGDVSLNKGLVDSLGSYGSSGNVLWSTGTSTLWVTTSTLGISGGLTVESDPIWLAASTSLAVSNFASPNISQWTNDAGYLTSINPDNIPLASGYTLVGNGLGVASATSTIFISSNGSVGIGTTSTSARLTVSGSNNSGITLYGLDKTKEIADFYVGNAGQLVITTKNTDDFSSWIELDPEDDQYGVVIRDGSTGSSAYANMYVVDTATDYLNLIVGKVHSGSNIGLVVTEDNYVGIGKIAPTTALDVVGTVSSTALRINSTSTIVGNLVLGSLSGLLLSSNGLVSSISTSSLNLSVNSFASTSVSQWTNDVGYLTSATAASTYLTQAAAGTTYLSLSNWYSTTTLPSNIVSSSLAQVGTITSGTWNGSVIADAYIADDITASNYLSLATWYATTSVSQFATLAGLTSIGSSGVTTTFAGNLAVNGNATFTAATLNGLSGNIITSNNIKTAITDLDTRLYNQQNTTKEMTGFPNRTDSTISFNDGTRNFTITGTNFKIYVAGKEYTKNTESISIPNTNGLYYVYYDKTTGNLSTSTSAWSLNDGTVQVATIYWNGTSGLIGEERHGLTMDGQTHEYLHTTVGTRYNSGFTGTFSSPPTFSVTGGSIYDEDINNSTTTTQTLTRILYRSGGSFTFTAPTSSYYYQNANIIQYDNAGTLTDVTNNDYVAYWVFATNDPVTPIYVLMGQRQDTTLANARANNTYESLSLTNLPFKEMKILYRVIIQRSGTNESYQETQDLRSVSNLASGTYVATAHGILTGLLNDDHTQYLLLAGRGGQVISDDISVGSLSTPYSLSVYGTSTLATTTLSVLTASQYVSTTQLFVSNSSTLGTVISGLWNGTAIGATYGGTGQTSVSIGDLLYGSGTNAWGKLSGPGAANYVLRSTGSNTFTWGALQSGDLPADGYASTYVNVSGDTMSGALVINNNLNVSGTSTLATTSIAYDSWIGSALGSKSLQFKDYTISNGSFVNGGSINFIDSQNTLSGIGINETLAVFGINDNPQIVFGGSESSELGIMVHDTSSRSLWFRVYDSGFNDIAYSGATFNTDNLIIRSDNNTNLTFSTISDGNNYARLTFNTSTDALNFSNASSYYFDNNVLPSSNLTYNLGSASARWDNLWVKTLNVGTSTWSIGPTNDGSLAIYDAASQAGNIRLYIATSTGNIGIGTTNPTSALHVVGTSTLATTTIIGNLLAYSTSTNPNAFCSEPDWTNQVDCENDGRIWYATGTFSYTSKINSDHFVNLNIFGQNQDVYGGFYVKITSTDYDASGLGQASILGDNDSGGFGVFGNDSSSIGGVGVFGNSVNGIALYGLSNNGGAGVIGLNLSTSSDSKGAIFSGYNGLLVEATGADGYAISANGSISVTGTSTLTTTTMNRLIVGDQSVFSDMPPMITLQSSIGGLSAFGNITNENNWYEISEQSVLGVGGLVVSNDVTASTTSSTAMSIYYGNIFEGNFSNNLGISFGSANNLSMKIDSGATLDTYLMSAAVASFENAGTVNGNVAALFADASNDGGVINGNFYGLYVGDVTGMGATINNYSIYTAGQGMSHFGGDVEIMGTTTIRTSVETYLGISDFVVSSTNSLINGVVLPYLDSTIYRSGLNVTGTALAIGNTLDIIEDTDATFSMGLTSLGINIFSSDFSKSFGLGLDPVTGTASFYGTNNIFSFGNVLGANMLVDNTFSINLSTSTQYDMTQANTMSIMSGRVGIGTTTPISTFQVVGTSTLATTTMAFNSKIGTDADGYMTIEDFYMGTIPADTFGEGDPESDLANHIPLIKFSSPKLGLNPTGNIGGINNGLYIVEDPTLNTNPSLQLISYDFISGLTFNSAKIEFATSTQLLSFMDAVNGYYFSTLDPNNGGSNGAVYSNNGVLTNVNPSSRTYKDNIASSTLNIDALLGLQVKSFNWKNGGQSDFGLIAEEIRDVLPELYVDNGQTKGYRADHLPFYLLQIAQRQENQIKVLSESFNTLSSSSTPNLGVISSPVNNDNFNNLSVSSAATFYGTITVIGEAGFESKVTFKNDVEIQGKLYLDRDQVGTAVIVTGSTTVQVIFEKPFNSIPKVLLNLNLSTSSIFARYAVSNKSTSSFTIVIDQPVIEDLYFDWVAFGQRGELTGYTPENQNNDFQDLIGDVVTDSAVLGTSSIDIYDTTSTTSDSSTTSDNTSSTGLIVVPEDTDQTPTESIPVTSNEDIEPVNPVVETTPATESNSTTESPAVITETNTSETVSVPSATSNETVTVPNETTVSQ